MHLRKCDSKTCELPATHWLVWTKPQFYCSGCADKMILVGAAIGIETAATTVRPMTAEEFLVPDETDEQDN